MESINIKVQYWNICGAYPISGCVLEIYSAHNAFAAMAVALLGVNICVIIVGDGGTFKNPSFEKDSKNVTGGCMFLQRREYYWSHP